MCEPTRRPRVSASVAATAVLLGVLPIVVLPAPSATVRLERALVVLTVLAAGFVVLHIRDRQWRSRDRELLDLAVRERTQSKQIVLATVQALARAVEARDHHNVGHLSRVERLAVAVARRLGLTEECVDSIRAAAWLHEIGRLGVPDSILTKSAALTESERGRVESYPVLGAQIIGAVPFPWSVAPLVLHHRELYDGSGYPDGLTGDDIPIGARVLAVADTYATLICARPYRPSHSHPESLDVMRRLSGTKLDPAVVGAFLAVVEDVRAAEAEGVDEGPAIKGAAHDISRAQWEMHALYSLACETGASLNLQTVAAVLARRAQEFVSADTTVVFMVDEGGEYLHAIAATGVNEAHYTDSLARYGTFLTGRAAAHGEVVRTGFLAGDVLLAASQDVWVPLRSTLIAPLVDNGRVIGTINAYHREPNHFSADDVRVLLMVASVAGSAVHNAWVFGHTQENAFTDPVTGLRNSRYMVTFLEREINRTRKNHRELAVLGIDLDQFKAVNDTLGHAHGDEVLGELGALFKTRVRNYDLVARTGGDEFTVVLPETTRDEAEVVADKLRSAVARYVEQSSHRFKRFPDIGISVGIAMFPRDGRDIESLLAHADRLMYLDKQSHRMAA